MLVFPLEHQKIGEIERGSFGRDQNRVWTRLWSGDDFDARVAPIAEAMLNHGSNPSVRNHIHGRFHLCCACRGSRMPGSRQFSSCADGSRRDQERGGKCRRDDRISMRKDEITTEL